MYSAIHYNGLATPQEGLSDIVGILTGTITDVNQLSTNTVTENCEIITTVLPGWELWDDLGADDKVVRAVVSDSPGQHKYIRFTVQGANSVYNRVYKDWDNTAHTGTQWARYYSAFNGSAVDISSHVWYDTNNTDTMTLISSSSNHFAGLVKYNNISTLIGATFISEHERLASWDTVENGHIPMVYNSNPIDFYSFVHDYCSTNSSASYRWYSYWFIKPQTVINGVEREITTYSDAQYTRCYPTTAMGGYGAYNIANNVAAFNDTFNPVDQVYDAPIADGGKLVYQLFPIGASNYTNNPHYLTAMTDNISSKCGIFLSSMDGTSGFSYNDRVTISGENYRVWDAGGSGNKYLLVTEK